MSHTHRQVRHASCYREHLVAQNEASFVARDFVVTLPIALAAAVYHVKVKA